MEILLTSRTTPSTDGIRLQLWVSKVDPDTLPIDLFVYATNNSLGCSEESSEEFVHIATYMNIISFPPAPSSTEEYVRRSYVDLMFPTQVSYEETFDLMQRQLGGLIQDMSKSIDRSINLRIV